MGRGIGALPRRAACGPQRTQYTPCFALIGSAGCLTQPRGVQQPIRALHRDEATGVSVASRWAGPDLPLEAKVVEMAWCKSCSPQA